MWQTMVSSTAVSRINTLSSRRNEILSKQREASQVLTQLDMQYNDLYRKWEANDKLVRNDIKVREKIKDLEEKRDQQAKELYGHIKRLGELDRIEKGVKSNEIAYKRMLDKEQTGKRSKQFHILHINHLIFF
jgi:hypothetical protein